MAPNKAVRKTITKGTSGTAPQQCFVHGKRRSIACLEEDGMGGFRCKPEFQCQISERNAEDARQRALCSTHGKIRSLDVLQDDGMGGKCCADNFQCQLNDSD